MDCGEFFQVGMVAEESFTVEETHTADKVDSGSLVVLATPQMIAFMEGVSHRLVASKLPEGFSSVGVKVDIAHLAPTPPGSSVRVKAEITEVKRSKITLSVEAHDESEKIGEGVHVRVAIEVSKFMSRVKAKQI